MWKMNVTKRKTEEMDVILLLVVLSSLAVGCHNRNSPIFACIWNDVCSVHSHVHRCVPTRQPIANIAVDVCTVHACICLFVSFMEAFSIPLSKLKYKK